jgi:hypothetical protein
MEIMCAYVGHLQNWVGQTVNRSWRFESLLLFWLTLIAMEVIVGLSKCLKKNLFDVSIRICMVQSKHYTRWVSLCVCLMELSRWCSLMRKRHHITLQFLEIVAVIRVFKWSLVMYKGNYGEHRYCTEVHEFPFTLFEVKYLCEDGS